MNPIIMIVFFWIVFAAVSKASKKNTKKPASSGAPQQTAKQAPAAEPEHKPLTPSLTEMAPAVPDLRNYEAIKPRTDTYVGSLGVASLEGIDPCHEEQSEMMNLLEETAPTEEPEVSVLPEFTGAGIAKAFVMSEILNRKNT